MPHWHIAPHLSRARPRRVRYVVAMSASLVPGGPLSSLRLSPPRPWLRSRFVSEAAVAVVLHGPTLDEAHVLLVRRATRHGDPWSGDMALPGGRRDPEDVDLMATAMRETHEEIGLALDERGLLGVLPPVVTLAPMRRAALGRARPMIVRPFVFEVAERVATTVSAEVVGTRWAALSELRSPARRATRPWRLFGITWPAPAWDLDGDVVWGLTHQMLRSLLRAM